MRSFQVQSTEARTVAVLGLQSLNISVTTTSSQIDVLLRRPHPSNWPARAHHIRQHTYFVQGASGLSCRPLVLPLAGMWGFLLPPAGHVGVLSGGWWD